jgi:hypothetical protein|tara:strand:- start:1387 stop:1653 length:267 start_codon:yes stop_codon:yes gene_type:complete
MPAKSLLDGFRLIREICNYADSSGHGMPFEFLVQNFNDGGVTGGTASFQNPAAIFHDLLFAIVDITLGATFRAINFLHNDARRVVQVF